MKFLIPYTSKKRNPNAGNTVYYINGRPTYYITTCITSDICDYALCINVESTGGFKYVVEDQDTFAFLLEKYSTIITKAIVEQNVQTIHSLSPQAEFLYEYNKEECVKCKYCDIRFVWTDLKEDFADDFECYAHSETVCPFCYNWECCELEFQK